ncbi:MAG TPA: hypothetical protein VH044_03530 [Polyangiaceae bacterium]|jgi:hypothetical protein|nr:hypothetical protein [Polyangiaceae bacterium]
MVWNTRVRATLSLATVFSCIGAYGSLTGCGGGGTGSGPSGMDATAPIDGSGMIFGGGDDGGAAGDDSATDAAPSNLAIAPLDDVLDVTEDANSGAISFAPLTYAATLSGVPVQANWVLDRGELGAVGATSGAFAPSGTMAGKGKITAAYGSAVVSTSITIRFHVVQSGGPGAVDGGAEGGVVDAGAGGFNGVGGEGFGGAPAQAIIGAFGADAAAGPATVPGMDFFPDGAAPIGVDAGTALDPHWLYPYDRTVWPLGLLPPLLQWETTHASQTVAVYVHLSEQNFSFDGYYAYPAVGTAGITDAARSRQPIDPNVWAKATYSNAGSTDYLRVDVSIATADGSVYGPITENWTIAPAELTGTVYYNSYESTLNDKTGAVLKIHPGDFSPSLALPPQKGQCHVCHTVSADGNTLFTQTLQSGSYDLGSSFDLQDGGSLIENYWSSTASDSTTNLGKFTFSGTYPNGQFAMACSGPDENWHHYQGNSDLFARDGGTEVPSTGFTNLVKNAVTPAFSPDGKHLAFSLWAAQANQDAGPNSPLSTAGSKAIVVMDFDCGADGGVDCQTSGTFSNPRELYEDRTASAYAAWPSFTPDGNALLFQHTLHPPPTGSYIYTHGDDSSGYPAGGALAELLYSAVPAGGTGPAPRLLCALNGYAAGCASAPVSYLPPHPTFRPQPNNKANTLYEEFDDTKLNFEPTINPVASGGYYWVVFTSRRRYGNVAAGYPYDGWDGQGVVDYAITKKLWVAAVDANTGEIDPSHPAFYLPGQEMVSGNMRGFWAVDPCHANGISCQSGEQCCAGFCRPPSDGGAGLVCSDMPPGGCAQETETCMRSADCCGAPTNTCVNGRCARPSPTPPPPPAK